MTALHYTRPPVCRNITLYDAENNMKTPATPPSAQMCTVDIPLGAVLLQAHLLIPEDAQGLIIFTHAGARLRYTRRDMAIARELHRYKLAALCVDLLSDNEAATYHNRFNVSLLTERLLGVTSWAMRASPTRMLPIGYFASGATAAAALKSANCAPQGAKAIVSIGGRVDLAADDMPRVAVPTLLIVGNDDYAVREANNRALKMLTCRKKMAVIAHATHLFDHPEALECVVRLASSWFHKYVRPSRFRRRRQ